MYIRRKVFSDTGYGYEPVEDVYNVTMTGDEVRLFSELQERMYGVINFDDKIIGANRVYGPSRGAIGYNSKELLDYIHESGNSVSELKQTPEGRAYLSKLKGEFEKKYLKKLTKDMKPKEAERFLKEEAKRQVNGETGSKFGKLGSGFKDSVKSAYESSKNWVKNNPKTAAAIGLGAAGTAATAAYLANRD
jgi:hypothetical protein